MRRARTSHRSRTWRPLTFGPRPLLAAGVVVAAAAAGVLALDRAEDAPRRSLVQVVGWQVAAELDPAPMTHLVERTSDTSDARPGTERGYRRALLLQEPGRDCLPDRQQTSCGAKLELFGTASGAAEREAQLRSRGEPVHRVGALVLRLHSDLEADRRAAYEEALRSSVEGVGGKSDLTRLDR